MEGTASEKPSEEKAPAAEKAAKIPKRGKGALGFILFMIVLGALAPVLAPTLLVCLGLLPSLVALFTDTDPRRSAFMTIGFLNLAGVVPFVIDLWQQGQTMENALHIVRQPLTWLVMFGAAGIGQLLLFSVPAAMTMMAVARMEARLKTLREALVELKTVWGDDVATATPLDAIRQKDKL